MVSIGIGFSIIGNLHPDGTWAQAVPPDRKLILS